MYLIHAVFLFWNQTRKVDIPAIYILLYAIFHMGQGEDLKYFYVDDFSTT